MCVVYVDLIKFGVDCFFVLLVVVGCGEVVVVVGVGIVLMIDLFDVDGLYYGGCIVVLLIMMCEVLYVCVV